MPYPQQSGTNLSSVVIKRDFRFGLTTSSSIRQVVSIATQFLQRIAGSLTTTSSSQDLPTGKGSAQIRRRIAANTRRVRWP